jgi:hypothetical protein
MRILQATRMQVFHLSVDLVLHLYDAIYLDSTIFSQ